MAYREVISVEIGTIRRWQEGISRRRIASAAGLSRQTVRRDVDAAEAAGLRPCGPAPGEEQLATVATPGVTRPRQVEAPGAGCWLAPRAEQIAGWLTADRLQVTRSGSSSPRRGNIEDRRDHQAAASHQQMLRSRQWPRSRAGGR